VIHVHFGHNGNLILPLKRIEPSTAFITMFHGHDLLMGLSDGKENYTDLFREADLILANSAYSLDRLLELGANPQRLRIHYVGIEMNKFPYRKEHPDLTQGAFRVLTICRLDEQKGLEYSIRAINRLVSTNPSISIEYRIVGGGCQEAFLKHLVEELNLSQQVYFLGPLDQEGVIRHLLNSDVFLLTSIREWLGMVLLEAQAVGLPIVATEIGGIPEAVVPGQSAILVPARNSLAAAEALTECLKNPIKRIEMGIAGRKHVEKNFDINNLNDKLECIYEDLCRSLKVTLASK
jgi:colanic acid/amylovoran biosynthesis glycosyltransferase